MFDLYLSEELLMIKNNLGCRFESKNNNKFYNQNTYYENSKD